MLIEASFKGLCPYVSQFLVHGADHNFVTALVTLDPDAIKDWADDPRFAGGDYRAIVTSPQAHAMVQIYVDPQRGLNRWETIKKFTILDKDLTVEEGDLTPSMKLRRRAVTEKHQPELDAMYADA